MSEQSPLSPEARAQDGRPHNVSEDEWFHELDPWHQAKEVVRRVAVGVYSDGFVHAGNFAYLAILAVFSFFIVASAIIVAFGGIVSGEQLASAFFATVPPSVAEALRGPIESAMTARSGPLLWIGALVGLWTTASLIEAFRDVLNRAYGTVPDRYFWHYRLGSIVTIIGAVFLAILAFSAQVAVSAIEEVIYRFFPAVQNAGQLISWRQVIPFIVLFAAIYVIFRGLTPRQYRSRKFAKWPGAAVVSLWWLACTSLLPIFIIRMARYDLTYGSLAGVMITLIFFYLIGLGLVTGAQLNAALANATENGLKGKKQDLN